MRCIPGRGRGHCRTLCFSAERQRLLGLSRLDLRESAGNHAGDLKDKVQEFAKGKDLDTLQLGRCMDNKETETEVKKPRER